METRFQHKKLTFRRHLFEALGFIILFFDIFGYVGHVMGLPNILNTIMQTSYHLLLEIVFYIMGITVLSGALGSLLVEFHVVDMLERILRPLMKSLYNLPGVSALEGILTFLRSYEWTSRSGSSILSGVATRFGRFTEESTKTLRSQKMKNG